MLTCLDREERDDRRQLIKNGGIREPATGLRPGLVERTKIYIYFKRYGSEATQRQRKTMRVYRYQNKNLITYSFFLHKQNPFLSK